MASANLIPCPHSLHLADLTTSFELHSAAPDGGVCDACRSDFARRNAAVVAGEIESPAILEWQHVTSGEEPAFDNSGETLTTHFDYDSLDEPLEILSDLRGDSLRFAADAISKIFSWAWQGQSRSGGELRAATARFSVVAVALNPSLLGGANQASLARILGLSKAAVSKCQQRFSEAFAFPASNQRSPSARARMSDSMTKSHARRATSKIKRATPSPA